METEARATRAGVIMLVCVRESDTHTHTDNDFVRAVGMELQPVALHKIRQRTEDGGEEDGKEERMIHA